MPKVAYVNVKKGKKKTTIEVLTAKGIMKNGRRLKGRKKLKKLMKRDAKNIQRIEKIYG